MIDQIAGVVSKISDKSRNNFWIVFFTSWIFFNYKLILIFLYNFDYHTVNSLIDAYYLENKFYLDSLIFPFITATIITGLVSPIVSVIPILKYKVDGYMLGLKNKAFANSVTREELENRLRERDVRLMDLKEQLSDYSEKKSLLENELKELAHFINIKFGDIGNRFSVTPDMENILQHLYYSSEAGAEKSFSKHNIKAELGLGSTEIDKAIDTLYNVGFLKRNIEDSSNPSFILTLLGRDRYSSILEIRKKNANQKVLKNE